MTAPATQFDYAPSIAHRRLMDERKRSFTFAGGDVAAWQAAFRPKLVDLLGISDLLQQERGPLNPRTLWKRDHDLGTIEKLVLTVEPGVDVPCYLCLPRAARPPYRLFICLQGHSTGMHNSIAVDFHDETTPITIAGDRDFGLNAMRYGIAALCIEQRSFGERREAFLAGGADQLCHHAVMNALMLGRTLMGERVFDIDRSLDYLADRGDIRMDQVGVMGNSGGGTATCYAAAVLPRIRAAMPSCAFCSFRDSIMAIYHCSCNFIPHLYEYAEMAEVVGLSAPKPMVIVSGVHDGIFPIAPTRAEFARLQKIYDAAGAADRIRLVEGPEDHRFYADLAWPAMLELLNS